MDLEQNKEAGVKSDLLTWCLTDIMSVQSPVNMMFIGRKEKKIVVINSKLVEGTS